MPAIALSCHVLQYYVKFSSTMSCTKLPRQEQQYNAVYCNTMQEIAVPCKLQYTIPFIALALHVLVLQYYARKSRTMRCTEISHHDSSTAMYCNAVPSKAVLCQILSYHATYSSTTQGTTIPSQLQQCNTLEYWSTMPCICMYILIHTMALSLRLLHTIRLKKKFAKKSYI